MTKTTLPPARELLSTARERATERVREAIIRCAERGEKYLVVTMEGENKFPAELELELQELGYSVEHHVSCPEHPDRCVAVIVSWDGPMLERLRADNPFSDLLGHAASSASANVKPS